MKKLEEFVSEINEGRPKGSKNKVVAENPKAPTFDEMDGKKPKVTPGSAGIKWGLNEPVNNEAVTAEDIDLNDPDNTDAMNDLIDKFDADEDFFVQGEAGWGKTTVIEKLAKKYKRHVLTVYLDKAEATDLGGIPIPVQGSNKKIKYKNALGEYVEGNFAVQSKAIPDWAAIMFDNPDKQFLLFFDEMNQAQDDVMQALMPIILKHEICGIEFNNFFVGAAGNMDYEATLGKLSGPLESRLTPVIMWTVGPKSWIQTFKYLHKKWDAKIGKDLVDLFDKYAPDCFKNPREVEHKIFKFIYNIKQDKYGTGTAQRARSDKYLRRLNALKKQSISRTDDEKTLPKLADAMTAYVKGTLDSSATGSNDSGSRKNRQMLPESIQKIFKDGIENGSIQLNGDPHRYGISKENIAQVIAQVDEEGALNAEMINMYIDTLIEQGSTFKYQTDEEWKKADASLEDPLKFLKINKDSKPFVKKKEEPKRKYKKEV